MMIILTRIIKLSLLQSTYDGFCDSLNRAIRNLEKKLGVQSLKVSNDKRNYRRRIGRSKLQKTAITYLKLLGVLCSW